MVPPRVLTGAIYVGLWVILAWLGGWPLTIGVAALAVLSILELKWVVSRRRVRVAIEVAYPVAFSFILAAHLFADDLENFGLAVLGLVLFMTLVDFAIHLRDGLRQPTAAVALTSFACLYCGLLLSAIVLLRGYQPLMVAPTWFGAWSLGRRLLFFLLIVTWVSDTAAYLVGKNWGRHKLAHSVSPNKTVEGCLGAVVGAVLAALIAGHVFNVGAPVTSELLPAEAARVSLWHRFVLGLLLGGFGQIGDFGASIFKREAEVKDYGWLLPGHGGFLDRLDSLLINAPLLYLYVLCSAL